MGAEAEIMMQRVQEKLPIIKMALFGISQKERVLAIEPMVNLRIIINPIFLY